jgi:hypothetical protein
LPALALRPFFDDLEVEEIWINEQPGKVFVAKAGRPRLATAVLRHPRHHRSLCVSDDQFLTGSS